MRTRQAKARPPQERQLLSCDLLPISLRPRKGIGTTSGRPSRFLICSHRSDLEKLDATNGSGNSEHGLVGRSLPVGEQVPSGDQRTKGIYGV